MKKEAQKLLEIERKYRLANQQKAKIESYLQANGFKPASKYKLTDTLLPVTSDGHNLRLRVQTSEDNEKESCLLTFKEMIESGNGKVERLEQEEEIGPVAKHALLYLAKQVCESPLSYTKQRSEYKGQFKGSTISIVFDQVDDLGRFSGLYMEVEVMVSSIDLAKSANNLLDSFVQQLPDCDSLELELLSFRQMVQLHFELTKG